MPAWVTALIAALPAIEGLIESFITAVENGTATTTQLDQLHDLFVTKAHIMAMKAKYAAAPAN